MRILHIIPYFFLSWSNGSPVELVHELATYLSYLGHDVTIYTTDVFNKKLEPIGKHSSKLINGYDYHVSEFESLIGYPICFSPMLIKSIFKTSKDFDIIHLHEYRTIQNIIARYSANRSQIPYILEAHGSLQRINRKSIKTLYDKACGFDILRDASRVIAITETEAEEYESRGLNRRKIDVIPNAIDFKEFENLPQIGKFKAEHGINNDKMITYIGRLDNTKGIDLLIKSFSYIAKDLKNIKLIIAGKDYGAEYELRQLVSRLDLIDDVLFVGFLSKKSKIEALRDSNVFVTPSYYGFPHTFLEACACGIPIVTTTKGDMLDWIDNNVGYRVAYDEIELAKSISKIITDDELEKDFGSKARSLAKEKFNWNVVIRDIDAAYKKAML